MTTQRRREITRGEAIARKMMQRNSHRQVAVLKIMTKCRSFRGKVNLGEAAGIRGGNDWKARPVEALWRMGALDQRWDGVAYTYSITPEGRVAYKAL